MGKGVKVAGFVLSWFSVLIAYSVFIFYRVDFCTSVVPRTFSLQRCDISPLHLFSACDRFFSVLFLRNPQQQRSLLAAT